MDMVPLKYRFVDQNLNLIGIQEFQTLQELEIYARNEFNKIKDVSSYISIYNLDNSFGYKFDINGLSQL